jgi:hypothetical protein
MLIYVLDEKKLIDVQTLICLTSYNKSKVLRLLKKMKVNYIRYQNRNIYYMSDIIEKTGIEFD